MRHVFSGVPHYRAVSVFLLQLALSLFGEVKMFLDHLGRVLGEFLHVGIGSCAGLLLKFSQILFVILHHHIHISFIGTPFFARLFAWQLDAFFLGDRLELVIGLGVIGDHPLAERFYILALTILLSHLSHCYLHHAPFGGFLHKAFVLFAK